jgi:ADP-ribose pyrophosphatase
VIEFPPSVVLVVADGDELVCVSQRRPGAGGVVLELPAGKMEPGETAQAAADRELAEECGLAVSGWQTLGEFWAAPEYSTERVTVLAGRCSGAASAPKDADEEIAVVRIPVGEALARLEDAGSLAAIAIASGSWIWTSPTSGSRRGS